MTNDCLKTVCAISIGVCIGIWLCISIGVLWNVTHPYVSPVPPVFPPHPKCDDCVMGQNLSYYPYTNATVGFNFNDCYEIAWLREQRSEEK